MPVAAKPPIHGDPGGGSSYTSFKGFVKGSELSNGYYTTYPLVGATVTARYWYTQGVAGTYEYVDSMTVTKSDGTFSLKLTYEDFVRWDWGVTIKAFMHDEANNKCYWTERMWGTYYKGTTFYLPRDTVTNVPECVQMSNTNYVNIHLVNGYQYDLSVSAFTMPDPQRNNQPLTNDLSWIKDKSYTAPVHGEVIGQMGEALQPTGKFWCTGQYSMACTYPSSSSGTGIVIEGASIYGSRLGDGVKGTNPEWLPFDSSTLTTWTCPQNSNVEAWNDLKYLSGSVTLPSNGGAKITVNCLGYSATKFLQTKLTTRGTSWLITCIAHVPDGQGTKVLGWKFEGTGRGILHVWCCDNIEIMMPSYANYNGATTVCVATDHYTSPWSAVGYSVPPTSDLASGIAHEGIAAVSSEYCPAWVDAYAGFSVPFIARAATLSVQCDWSVSWSAEITTFCEKEYDTGMPIGEATATVRILAVIEVYDVTSGLLAGRTSATVLDVTKTEGVGHAISDIDWSASGITTSTPVMSISATAGHTYKVVTSVNAYVYTEAGFLNEAYGALHIEPAKSQYGALKDIKVIY
jgi:hypothetical protein